MRSLVKIGALVIILVTASACDPNPSPVRPTATAAFTPVPVPTVPVPAVPGTLVVESFSVVEFLYPSQAAWWYYAPLIRVHAPDGPVTVTRLDIVIPGLLNSPHVCLNKRVESAQRRDLFREVYGDYELSYDGGRAGVRATAGLAQATITYTDDTGAIRVVKA